MDISVTINCGGSSSQNITTFLSSGAPAGACNVKIHKISSKIEQLRLDFISFVLNGPSASTVTTFATLNGISGQGTGNGLSMTNGGQCDVDSFSVSSPGNSGTPLICGTNSGEHCKYRYILQGVLFSYCAF